MKKVGHGRSIAFAYFGVALPALVGLLLYPKLIHNLGPERFGALSLVLSIALFFSNFDFGVGLAVTRFIARLDGRNGARGGIRRLIRNAIWLQMAIGLMTGGLLLSVHHIWGFLRTDLSTGLHEEFNVAILWLSISIPLALIAGVVRNGFEGIGRFGIANALRAPASIGVFAVPIALSFFTTSIDALTLALLLTRVVTTVSFVFIWSRFSPPEIHRSSRMIDFWRQSKVLLSYGGWVMVGVAAGGLIVMGILDRILIARLVDIAAVVYYAVSNDVIVRALLIPSAIASVLLTVLTRTFVAHHGQVPYFHRQATQVMADQVGPIAVLLVLNAKPLLGMLTGKPVPEDAVWILQGMATGYYIHALAHIPYCALHAAGAPKAAGFRHLVQLPAYATSSAALLLTGYIGLMGWLWCLWAVIDLLMLLVLMQRFTPQQHILPAITQPRVLAWVALIAFSNLVPILPIGDATAIALSILAVSLFMVRFAQILMDDFLLSPFSK
jgi:O-antigen/teichoic acid export membrane protein